MHFPDPQISTSIETLMPVLVGMLKDVPFIDFDKSLSWTGMICLRLSELKLNISNYRLGFTGPARFFDHFRIIKSHK
jgi:hypothetical protein